LRGILIILSILHGDVLLDEISIDGRDFTINCLSCCWKGGWWIVENVRLECRHSIHWKIVWRSEGQTLGGVGQLTPFKSKDGIVGGGSSVILMKFNFWDITFGYENPMA